MEQWEKGKFITISPWGLYDFCTISCVLSIKNMNQWIKYIKRKTFISLTHISAAPGSVPGPVIKARDSAVSEAPSLPRAAPSPEGGSQAAGSCIWCGRGGALHAGPASSNEGFESLAFTFLAVSTYFCRWSFPQQIFGGHAVSDLTRTGRRKYRASQGPVLSAETGAWSSLG